MLRAMAKRRPLIAITAPLALLAACTLSNTQEGGWVDSREPFSLKNTGLDISKAETGGPARLRLRCNAVFFDINRDRFGEPSEPTLAPYRFDDAPFVAARARYSGAQLDYSMDGLQPDPLYPALPNARRLTIVVMPRGEAPYVMEFDLAGAGEAMRRRMESESCRPG